MFLFVIFAIIFFQLLCVGANFPSLPVYQKGFGAEEAAIAFLFVAFTAPRAIVAPAWGMLSDRIGRRPLMIFGGIAVMVGSVIWIIADNWWMLMASRLIDGFFSAQAVIIAAIITDRIEPAKRARAFGALGAGVSLGLTLGPIWGALVTESFGASAVGYGFILLQSASLFLVVRYLPETLDKKAAQTASKANASSLNASWVQKWFSAYSFPKGQTRTGRILRQFLIISLLSSLVISSYTTAMPLVTEALRGWGALEFAKLFSLFGFTSALVQGGLLRFLLKYVNERRILIVGLGLMAMGYGILMAGGIEGLWIGTFVLAIGGGLAAPCITNEISHRASVPDKHQPQRRYSVGQVLGLNQTLQTLGRSIGFLLAAAGFLLHPLGAFAMPLVVGFGLFIWTVAKVR